MLAAARDQRRAQCSATGVFRFPTTPRPRETLELLPRGKRERIAATLCMAPETGSITRLRWCSIQRVVLWMRDRGLGTEDPLAPDRQGASSGKEAENTVVFSSMTGHSFQIAPKIVVL